LYLKPFHKEAQAGAATFMSGYHSIDGVVCTANRWLLRDVLKEEWGFEGFVITDWFNVGHMVEDQKVSPDLTDATRRAVEAGNDMSMTTPEFCELAVALVKAGKLDEALIDDGCRRVLRLKFMLGLFDDRRYTDLGKQAEWIGRPEHRQAALETAYQSAVLLKNEGVLPISPPVKKIAVLGPNADDVVAQLGDWVSWEAHGEADGRDRPRELTTTILDGIRARGGKKIEVTFNRGCSTLADEEVQLRLMDAFEAGAGLFYEEMLSKMGPASIDTAVQLAARADLAIVVVGDNRPYIGEFRDRANLDLSGEQQALLEAVKATGTPLVVVVLSSKPLSIPWAAQEADALVQAFNPGMPGGEAIAGLLFGDRDFTGKLTVSFPYHVGQLPVYYNHFPGWHGGKYVDMPAEPLYAFGFGLHYTTFVYRDLRILTPVVHAGETARVQVTVRNTGGLAATEIVQMYINDVVSSVITPVKELKAFARVALDPGQEKTVELVVPYVELALVNEQLETAVEPGVFSVMVGSSSRDEDLLVGEFEVG
jgi:beta-glucosidase